MRFLQPTGPSNWPSCIAHRGRRGLVGLRTSGVLWVASAMNEELTRDRVS